MSAREWVNKKDVVYQNILNEAAETQNESQARKEAVKRTLLRLQADFEQKA